MTLPGVTCLCTTAGRFTLLREAIHQFLQQDYPNRELLIFNNHAVPLFLSEELQREPIRLVNAGDAFDTYGQVLAAAAAEVRTEYLAHWDDDDLYLPGHLSGAMGVLAREGKKFVKHESCWMAGDSETGAHVHAGANVLEPTWVMETEFARAVGYDPEVDVGPALPIQAEARRIGEYTAWRGTPTFIYRWGFRKSHLSAGPACGGRRAFLQRNRDHGNGEPLTPRSSDALRDEVLARARRIPFRPNQDVSRFNLVAFSRDRACQLHALLSSFRRHVGAELPRVVYAASESRFAVGYDRLRALMPDVSLVSEQDGFAKAVRRLLDPKRPYTAFFVDDLVFRRPFHFDGPEVAQLDEGGIACLSLRLSPRIGYCYMFDRPTPAPVDGAGTWAWRGQPGDWGYPMSLDAHVFLTSDVAPRIEALQFRNPNELEAGLAGAPIDKPRMACLADHCVVNVPTNRVQRVFPNRHAHGPTAAELNDLFLAGQVIDTRVFDDVANDAVHFEMDHRFVSAEA